MRVLKVVTILMGVLIVGGTALLGVLISKRISGVGGGAPVEVRLSEPAGTRIAGIAASADRLAVQLQGGGPDRVLLLDPRTGARTGSVALGQ